MAFAPLPSPGGVLRDGLQELVPSGEVRKPMIIAPIINVNPQINTLLGLNLAVLSPGAQQAIANSGVNTSSFQNQIDAANSILAVL
jgi:hypothetical protein